MDRSHVRTSVALSFAVLLVVASSCGKKNHPADIPTVPAGRDSCLVDTVYVYTAVAVDPDGDSVAVRIDWGDSVVSGWTALVRSGDTIEFSHAWSAAGTYEVRAQARDEQLLSSDWSAGLAVQVFVARPAPDAPTRPGGPDRGDQSTSYAFYATALHPLNMPVAIRFAWGDGDTSFWSAFVAPHDTVWMEHVWSVPDTYAVTAQAKDTGNATSQWSAPDSIRIWPPDTLCLWRVKLTAIEGRSFYSSPAFGLDGSIYVGSPDGVFYSLRTDSTVQWTYATGGDIRSSPAVAPDGTIYVGSSDNIVYAVNPDGSIRWTYTTDDDIVSSPAIGADGTIYITSQDRWFHAINPEDGSRKWHVLANRAGRSSPAVAADSVIYVGTDDDRVCAVKPDGNVKWEYRAGGAIHSSPCLAADGTLYCGSDDGNLYALDPAGSLKWQFATGGVVLGSAAIAPDGTIYFGSDDGFLYALNPNGSLRWRFPTGGSISGSPAVASDGTIYIGSADYSVYALNPNGTARWQFESDGAIQSSPTIGPDGRVYFTSKDGYLYALKGTSPLAGSAWPKFHHDLRNTGRVGGGG